MCVVEASFRLTRPRSATAAESEFAFSSSFIIHPYLAAERTAVGGIPLVGPLAIASYKVRCDKHLSGVRSVDIKVSTDNEVSRVMGEHVIEQLFG